MSKFENVKMSKILNVKMSSVLCQVSDLDKNKDQGSGSDVRYQMSELICHMLYVKYQQSNVKFKISNFKCQMSNVKC